MMTYTGVGSRETPPGILAKMTELASLLAVSEYTLRSGGADGADAAFEAGAGAKTEIFLPWAGFNGHRSPRHYISEAAFAEARKVHPVWGNLTPKVRALHARNTYQVLGQDLDDPSDFLVCWTPDGCEKEAARISLTGGTGTAIVLARRHNIRVFNLFHPGSRRRLTGYLLEQDLYFPRSWISDWLGENA